jgi:hypothetical protein
MMGDCLRTSKALTCGLGRAHRRLSCDLWLDRHKGWLTEHKFRSDDFQMTNLLKVFKKLMPKRTSGEGWYRTKPAHYLAAAYMKPLEGTDTSCGYGDRVTR